MSSLPIISFLFFMSYIVVLLSRERMIMVLFDACNRFGHLLVDVGVCDVQAIFSFPDIAIAVYNNQATSSLCMSAQKIDRSLCCLFGFGSTCNGCCGPLRDHQAYKIFAIASTRNSSVLVS